MADLDDMPGTTLDVAAYPDPDELADEVLQRLRFHGSLVITDPSGGTFAGFLIWWWRGAYVVCGSRNQHLGTFASVEAAIGRGRTAPRDHGAGDDHADALA